MNPFTTKRRSLGGLTLLLALAALLASCNSGSSASVTASALTRPVAMVTAMIPWQPTESEKQLAQTTYKDAWEACLGRTTRPFAFVANSANNSVARIDLCTQTLENTHLFGNPFVVTNIPVGEFPVAVAVSRDTAQSRIFVANSGENTLSLIDSALARPLENKVSLPSRPSKLVVVPSASGVEQGDLLVLLPEIGSLARVVKQPTGEFETWKVEQLLSLASLLTPSPKPSALVLSPGATYLYIADAAYPYFHVLDLQQADYPARERFVNGPQRDLALSPDGRFLYLAKLDVRKVAVYDLVDDRYVDTNGEKPAHWNAPPPSDAIEYDIVMQAVPRLVRFAMVDKAIADGDTDAESDTAEAESQESESEAETVRKADVPADGDGESAETGESEAAEDDGETLEADASLYAYVVGVNGNVQVVDVHKNLHKFYDVTPTTAATFSIPASTELELDSGRCTASFKAKVSKEVTPDALWQTYFNTVLPETDIGSNGRFDFATNRFYDESFNFATLKSLRTRVKSGYDPQDRWQIKGDLLEIRTAALKPGDGGGVGCLKDGVGIKTVRLEILEATPTYLVVDPAGLNLKDCFDPKQLPRLDYVVRANDNYLVYMTPIDSSGNVSGLRTYQGRAVNAPFSPNFSHPDETTFRDLILKNPDWSDYVCTLPHTQPDGTVQNEYRFTTDLLIGGTDTVLHGVRCLNPWDDPWDGKDAATHYYPSFVNSQVSFTVCIDPTNEAMAKKLQGSYTYSFITRSGVGSVTQTNSDGSVTSFVGAIPEDAAVLNVDPRFPRLYLLDSSHELIYVVDLITDKVVAVVY